MDNYYITIHPSAGMSRTIRAGNNRRKAESYARYLARTVVGVFRVTVTRVDMGDVFRITRTYNMKKNRTVNSYWSRTLASA